MMDEVKKESFRFKRPWETPPYEGSTSFTPALLCPMKTEVPDSASNNNSEGTSPTKITQMDNLKGCDLKKEQSIGSNFEDFEVFRFDRDNLVLTSEKVVIVKKELCPDSPVSIPSVAGSSSKSSKKSSISTSTSTSKGSSSTSSTGSSSSSSSSNSSGSGSSSSSSTSSSSSDSESDLEDGHPSSKKPKAQPQPDLKKVKREEIKVEVKVEPADVLGDDDAEEEESVLQENNYPLEALKLKLLEEGSNDEEDDEEEEEEEEEESELEAKVRLEDFTEGRNRERKNSKWADYGITRKSSRLLTTKTTFCNKAHKAQALKKLTQLLKKEPDKLTEEDRLNLNSFPELTSEARKRVEKRQLASERLKEEEDPMELLDKKCLRLSKVIERSKYLVVFTGAGISTSALIPDYRGPNGIWTLLRKGQSLEEDLKRFPQSADPTLTHMAIKELYERGVVKHIVSQNVDGLHLRSGICKQALSEVHGNMYIEVCVECHREYVRLFDVTENTRVRHHKTGRFCYHCGSPLKDSVVLFGEKGSLRWPINWAGAEYNVDKADVILCIGSSLKVLRRYPWLWCMHKPAKQRPKLYIVNLQWTPKDRFAALKINGRCDEVIAKVMDNLRIAIPAYKREEDALFTTATLLHPSELSTKKSKELTYPEGFPFPPKSINLQNYFRFEPVFSKEVRALNEVKRKVVDGEEHQEGVLNNGNNNGKSKSLCGIGWLGNALSVKPKKRKVNK